MSSLVKVPINGYCLLSYFLSKYIKLVPKHIDKRFVRIHCIIQTEVCHLWNLVELETREGEVFLTLLKKLEEERSALGGQVFDVLGDVSFDHRPLRDLIVEAIR